MTIGVAGPPSGHGNEAGYVWHRRHGQPACKECRHGHARYRQSTKKTAGRTNSVMYNRWPTKAWRPSAGMVLDD